MRISVIAVVLILCGCSNGTLIRQYALADSVVELADTPFFPQARYQCGPAALATVLAASGVDIAPSTLFDRVYLPGRRGSLQPELIAATRHYGHVPYVLVPDLKALLLEVAAGTPVLVMQNLALNRFPWWHYAVVVGYDSNADTLLLRSGTKARLRMSRVRFEATWARAGQWAMVAASPSQIPVSAGYADWMLAVSAFEELDQPLLAEKAYRAASERWPTQVLVWQAMANARYAQGDLKGAESALRYALQMTPSVAAHNNLAHVMLQQGCPVAAVAALQQAKTLDEDGHFAGVLASTASAISAHPAAGCRSDSGCVQPCLAPLGKQ